VITFQNWLDRVWSDCELEHGKPLTYDVLTDVLLKALTHIDHHVGGDGYIHNPAPRDDRGSYNYPEQRFRVKTFPRRR
jgi:hypothetical protein